MTRRIRTPQPARRPAHRGVVLIVVLGMLAALALLGIAFLSVSGQEEQSSRNYGLTFQTPRPDLDPNVVMAEILGQILADTDNPHSAFRGHSFLRDAFGNNNDFNGNRRVDLAEYWARAFDGAGELGPDGLPGTADDADVNYVYALDPTTGALRTPERNIAGNPVGGLDEDYDYVDYNNMAIAAIRADGTVMAPSYFRPGYVSPSEAPDPLGGGPPWQNVNDWNDTYQIGMTTNTFPTGQGYPPARGRRLILRPRRKEHPSFGPADLTTPQVFDVDNMGLGRTDSVWLDPGLPVMQTLDGRKFKVMAAVLNIDLDGKLNLNVHGKLDYDKLDASGSMVYPNAVGDGTPDSHADIAPGTTHGAGGIVPYMEDLVLGQGFAGPTAVALQNAFSPLFGSSGDAREYAWIVQGRPPGVGTPALSQYVPGRDAERHLLGSGTPPRPGSTYSGAGPYAPADDNLPGYLGAARGNETEGRPSTAGGVYKDRSPPDFDDNGAIVAGVNGVPLLGPPGQARLGWGGTNLGWPAGFGHTTQPENVDEAAERNPYVAWGTDSLFTPHEIELLYRAEDLDWSSLLRWLPGTGARTRLAMLAPSLFDATSLVNRRRRFMLSTESWDLIRPNLPPLLAWESTATPPANAIEGNGIFPFSSVVPFRNILPQAILSGRRLAINPQFPPAVLPPLLPDANKQRFARELYLLFRAAASHSFVGPDGKPGLAFLDDDMNGTVDDVGEVGWAGTDDLPLRQIKRIAQYCINAVDFSDTEGVNPVTGTAFEEVMTWFEYPLNPLLGWTVDNVPTTDEGPTVRGIAWGVDAPARLVINEVLAYENPSGSVNLWIELYNPSPYDVELFNATLGQSIYEIVVTDAATLPTAEGEPPVGGSTLRFDMPAPTGPIPAGGSLVIGPGGPAAMLPAELGMGPFGTPERYSPTMPFTGGIVPGSQFRVYLRRLANPYQPELGTAMFPNSVNPYITVDCLAESPAGATNLKCYVFDDGAGGADGNPDFVNDPHLCVSQERRSLGVAYTNYPAPVANSNNPTHSLGGPAPAGGANTNGSPNSTNALDVYPYAMPDGTPDAWPWLVFHDRPFASPMDLLLVPATSPQTLTCAIAYPLAITPLDPFTPDATGQATATPLAAGTPADPMTPFREPGGPPPEEFLNGHLLNFFREVDGWVTSPMPGYYRLFEYVEVPSRINGAHDPAVPQVAGDTAGNGRQDRVPGRLNLNTVFEEEVFMAAMNNHPFALRNRLAGVTDMWYAPSAQIPTFDENLDVQWADRGSGFGQPFTNLNSELFRRVLFSIANKDERVGVPDPDGTRLFTLNDRPFRSFAAGASGSLVAPNHFVPPPASIHSTFFRLPVPGADLTNPGTIPSPVFEDNRSIAPPGLASPSIQDDFAYFRWQVMEKLSNVFTTRSNVYAVWITIGFFEVVNDDPNRLSATEGITNAPPELGAEINADIGQNIRHRAFFIVDRSRARGYTGPPRSSAELQDILSQVVIHSRIIE